MPCPLLRFSNAKAFTNVHVNDTVSGNDNVNANLNSIKNANNKQNDSVNGKNDTVNDTVKSKIKRRTVLVTDAKTIRLLFFAILQEQFIVVRFSFYKTCATMITNISF